MKNKKLINEFENYLLNEKSLSEKTLNYYIKDLKNFFEILNNKDALEINEKDIEIYIKASILINKKNTVLRKLSTVKVFFDYLFLKNKLDRIISIDKLELLNNLEKIENIDLEDFKKIIEEIKENTIEEMRDKLFIKILFYTKAKLSEVLNIKLENFFNNKFLIINEKLISLDEELIDNIDYYIKNIRLNLLDKEKNKFLFYDLNRNLFWSRLKIYAKKAKIIKNISPKLLIIFFKDNLNDLEIKKIMGMKNLEDKELNVKELYNNIKIGD